MVATLLGKKAALRRAVRAENEQCKKQLAEDLHECLANMAKNEAMFNLELDEALLESYIYERRALQCRYRHLLEKARLVGLQVRGCY